MQKPHSVEAACKGALADTSGAAVEDVPAEASCPGRRRLKGLGEGMRFWGCLPFERRYVRDGFGLGDFRFAVVQVE